MMHVIRHFLARIVFSYSKTGVVVFRVPILLENDDEGNKKKKTKNSRYLLIEKRREKYTPLKLGLGFFLRQVALA